MKILLLYTYNQGYLSRFFVEVAERLSKDGHDVTCFSLKSQSNKFDNYGVRFNIAKRGGYFRNYREIFKVIKSSQPDVVLSNFSYVNPALLFGKLLGVQMNVAWFHSLNEQTEATVRKIYIKRLFLNLADITIANSLLTQKQLHTIYKIPNHKIKSVPFWTSILSPKGHKILNACEPYSDYIKIGCPGRLVTHKNHRIVVDALSELINKGHEKTILFIAGSGEERTSLEDYAASLSIAHRVIFLEHLSHDDMVSFYNSMDVVVLPSLHEAFGLVFIEAISLGIPVVVSENFGALTFVEADRYYLKDFTFDPESVDSLVEKLMPYVEGRRLSGTFFKKLYQENFDKEIIYHKLRSILTT